METIYISEAGNEHKDKSQASIDSFIHEFADILSKSVGFEDIYINFSERPPSEQIMIINQLKGLGIIVLLESDKIMKLLKKYQLWYEE